MNFAKDRLVSTHPLWCQCFVEHFDSAPCHNDITTGKHENCLYQLLSQFLVLVDISAYCFAGVEYIK